MDLDRIARLTEQQRVCLRYVYAHMTSKEIAPHLGIEPGSVDQHIKAAMRVLGVGDRRAAARMLAEHESLVPLHAFDRSPARSASMREDPIEFEPTPPRLRRWRVPLPTWGTRPSELSPWQRLAWVFAIMMAFAFAFGVFLAGIEALSRMGRAIARGLL